MMSRLLVVLPVVLFAVGCGDNSAVRPKEPATAQTATTGHEMKRAASVGVSDDIVRACSIQFSNVDRAPKFDFDRSDLPPADRDVLAQIARCVTTGPLKGRALRLVGRTDNRGEPEYNMTLGSHRADAVRRYLDNLGVDDKRVSETSRGELDASGRDEAGYQKDRRVDITLQ
jgi:peptidoglycan-associated lipoprotein